MTSRRDLIARLERHDLVAKKSLGQNFLVDPSALDAIADATGEGPLAIEIGPGPGTLTERLLDRFDRVVAIEKDQRMIAVLESELESDALELVHADVLTTDVAFDAPIAGNIPYNITTPILLKLLENRARTGHAVVMIQREVADRLTAQVGTKAYGSLTILFTVHAAIGRVRNVPATCFVPRPRVDSTVLRFDWRDEPLVQVADAAHFEAVVRAAFGQRRKTLKNALSARFDPDAVARAGTTTDLSRRAETLTPQEFSALAAAIDCPSRPSDG